ncbi:uncharacterized protein LOC136072311 [Hydra vulgaris]|uniref:uncharacterized protein LOC136072311 n=1 Tax=Hydra vulgaris TaxID=6087 RepID=UPI0032EA63A9
MISQPRVNSKGGGVAVYIFDKFEFQKNSTFSKTDKHIETLCSVKYFCMKEEKIRYFSNQLDKHKFDLKRTPAIINELTGRKNKFGFQSRCSTEHAIIKLADKIFKSFDSDELSTNLYERTKKIARTTYFKNKLLELKGNCKKTWDAIKEILGKQKIHNKALPSVITVDGTQISDVKSVATKFNEFFVNIGPNLASKIKHTPAHFLSYLSKSDKSLAFKKLTGKEIDDSIKKLNKNKTTGYDAISASIIKDCYELIKDVLLDIFNKSLKTGVFPEKMKVAIITPIFKSGDKSLVTNYRPISVLPVFSKILERIMYNRIFAFLYDNNLLYWNQYGFRSNYSTEHALMQLVEVISEASSHNKGVQSNCKKHGLNTSDNEPSNTTALDNNLNISYQIDNEISEFEALSNNDSDKSDKNIVIDELEVDLAV